MTQLKQVNNQELIRELEVRIKTKQIKEQELIQLLETRKKQRLAEYEEASNDPEENEELKVWKVVETENWDD